MRKVVRIVAAILVGLVAVLAVAWVGLQGYLHSGSARDLAAGQFKARLGSDVRVHMASVSATGINLTLVLDAPQVGPAMRRLHDAFFGAPDDPCEP